MRPRAHYKRLLSSLANTVANVETRAECGSSWGISLHFAGSFFKHPLLSSIFMLCTYGGNV